MRLLVNPTRTLFFFVLFCLLSPPPFRNNGRKQPRYQKLSALPQNCWGSSGLLMVIRMVNIHLFMVVWNVDWQRLRVFSFVWMKCSLRTMLQILDLGTQKSVWSLRKASVVCFHFKYLDAINLFNFEHCWKVCICWKVCVCLCVRARARACVCGYLGSCDQNKPKIRMNIQIIFCALLLSYLSPKDWQC